MAPDPDAIGSQLELSTSPATSANGLFSADMCASLLLSCYLAGASGGADDSVSFTPTALGTYYWSADGESCAGAPSYACGDIAAPTWNFTVTPAPPPALQSPSGGSRETTYGSPITFTFNLLPVSGDTTYSFVASPSSAVDPNGVLAQPNITAELPYDTGDGSYTLPAASDVPGQVYWQVVRYDCIDSSSCAVPSNVAALTLAAPVLRLSLTGPRSIHLGQDSAEIDAGCNQPCTGVATFVATVFKSGRWRGVHSLSQRYRPARIPFGKVQPYTPLEGNSHGYSALLSRLVNRYGSVRMTVSFIAAGAGVASSTATKTVVIERRLPAAPPPPTTYSCQPVVDPITKAINITATATDCTTARKVAAFDQVDTGCSDVGSPCPIYQFQCTATSGHQQSIPLRLQHDLRRKRWRRSHLRRRHACAIAMTDRGHRRRRRARWYSAGTTRACGSFRLGREDLRRDN